MDETKHSFEYYYKKCYKQVYGYILKKTSNHHVAEDLAMDSFLACFQKFDSFDPAKASFQTWLYVVVNNKVKNYYRDHKEHENVDDCTEFFDSFEDDLVAAENLKELRRILSEALKTLPESQRLIVELKYFRKMQAKEIGQTMGMSPGNVRVILSRTVDKLRAYFAERGITWEG